jgi:hypothetical protein
LLGKKLLYQIKIQENVIIVNSGGIDPGNPEETDPGNPGKLTHPRVGDENSNVNKCPPLEGE